MNELQIQDIKPWAPEGPAGKVYVETWHELCALIGTRDGYHWLPGGPTEPPLFRQGEAPRSSIFIGVRSGGAFEQYMLDGLTTPPELVWIYVQVPAETDDRPRELAAADLGSAELLLTALELHLSRPDSET